MTPKMTKRRNNIRKGSSLKYIKANYQLYLMLIPSLIMLIVFKYVPMYGLIIAFKNYNVLKGIGGSQWVGLEHFERFIHLASFKELFMNTFSLSINGLIWGFGFPILIALLINQVRYAGLKNKIQLILYAPNFISTVVVVGMVFIFFNPNGPVNSILLKIGLQPIMFMTEPNWFQPLYISSGIWQGAGWGSVIYLAALASIDPQLHEAAKIDGANILQRIWFIELPELLPTAAILLILSVGGIMAVGHEKAFLMQTALNIPSSEIISTYVYKMGLQQGDYSFSTAVGLFNSLINLFLLLFVNYVVKKLNKNTGI
jgi:ABC-type polysaccharide transport system, permease component